jgi:hypothetical protein
MKKGSSRAKSLQKRTCTPDPISRPTHRHLGHRDGKRYWRCCKPPRLHLLRGRGGRARRSPVLKTFAAIDGTPLRRLERNGRFFCALRANRFGFHSLCCAARGTTARRAVCFARFTPFGLVLEALIGEKHLLARCKNKLGRTFGALQDPIVVFHTLLQSELMEYGSGTVHARRNGKRLTNRRLLIPPDTNRFEWTQTNWSPSLAHAVAFFGDAYARGPLSHDAFHLVSCNSCAF